jgi:hypothetical protein
MIWLTISVCPSVWACSAVDSFNLVLVNFDSSFIKSEINYGPRSLVIVRGQPLNLQT